MANFHAGVDTLCSKSMDRDSDNSDDWFDRLDCSWQDNPFGTELPVADKTSTERRQAAAHPAGRCRKMLDPRSTDARDGRGPDGR